MAYPKRAVSPEKVERANALRAMPLLQALEAVGAYAKLDASYVPEQAGIQEGITCLQIARTLSYCFAERSGTTRGPARAAVEQLIW